MHLCSNLKHCEIKLNVLTGMLLISDMAKKGLNKLWLFEITYIRGSCVAASSVGRFGWEVSGTTILTSILFEETKQTIEMNRINRQGNEMINPPYNHHKYGASNPKTFCLLREHSMLPFWGWDGKNQRFWCLVSFGWYM
jgi:hypothetical protein